MRCLREFARTRVSLAAACLFVTWVIPSVALAQFGSQAERQFVKEHFTKYEYRIPMRDGVRLFTSVYVPKDQSQKYPFFMTRTPYSVRPYGADQYRPRLGYTTSYDKSGYIFVYQDVRGCNMSEGQFVNVRPYIEHKKTPKDIDESSDTYDTIDWLLRHVPNNNGKVGITGISYPGFYTACGMIDAHPALKAASPQAPVTDWFIGDDFHHNGAFFLGDAMNFLPQFDRPHPRPTTRSMMRFERRDPDVYRHFMKLGPLSTVSDRLYKGETAFLKQMTQHGAYDDYWKARNILPHLKHIKPAVMTVGGWFDAEDLYGALHVFERVEKQSPETKNSLVMGPWIHGGWARGDGSKWGDVSFNAKTSEFYREHIEFPFFEYYLKGKGSPDNTKAWVFETGTNVWRKCDTWPPKGEKSKSFYFQPAGKLADTPPAADASNKAEVAGTDGDHAAGSDGSSTGSLVTGALLSSAASHQNGAAGSKSDKDADEYVSDPAHPVPFIDGTVNSIAREYMVADQRFASRRQDVAVYTGPKLEKDLTIAGPITANLFVSTSGTDSDWVVKLIDVYPDDYPDPEPNPKNVHMGGYQQLVRAEIMRGKFRNSYEKPEPFVPNKPTPVKFTLNDAYHTFRSGHRVMIQVQSSWFPLADRNPQIFTDIYAAKDSDYHKATERVYHSPDYPSNVTVLLAP